MGIVKKLKAHAFALCITITHVCTRIKENLFLWTRLQEKHNKNNFNQPHLHAEHEATMLIKHKRFHQYITPLPYF